MRRIAAAIVTSVSRRRRAAARERGARRESATPAPAAATPPAARGRRRRAARGAPPAAEGVEPKITVPGAEGDYLRTLHQRIHFRFAHRFIEDVAAKQPATDPLNRPGLRAEVHFGVRWDGSVSDVVVNQKSGVDAFDKAALAAVRVDRRRYPPPPAELFGDDGVAHFRWVFARNHDLCGDGSVRRVEAPLAEALPRLFVQGRIKEAMLRAARDSRGGFRQRDGNVRARLAGTAAGRSRPPTPRAAAALLRYGDKRMQAKALPADQAGARAQGDRADRGARRWRAYASTGGAELDPAGFCDLLGGARRCAKAIRPRASR